MADDPAYADVARRMKGEIDRRWNYTALERDIPASQKRRLFVQEAILKGAWTGWDHQPKFDTTRAYVRVAVDPNTTATKARRRFSFVAEVNRARARPKSTCGRALKRKRSAAASRTT